MDKGMQEALWRYGVKKEDSVGEVLKKLLDHIDRQDRRIEELEMIAASRLDLNN